MELDESYDISYFELEASVREKYSEGIRRLRESEDSQEQFKILKEMLDSLSKSHPSLGKGPEWARESISAYRNLGRILMRISRDPKSSILETLSRHKDLLDKYKTAGDEDHKALDIALDELESINGILIDYDVDVDNLEVRLEAAKEAEGKIRILESL